MFTPQIEDQKHVLKDVIGLEGILQSGAFPDLSIDLVDAILEEAGKFARDVIAPLNKVGDEHGCKLDNDSHAVTTAPGWPAAYKQWSQGGWAALPCDEEFGGQGLPTMIGLAAQELWNTASGAFAIGPLLTQSAVNALSKYGADELKQAYLENMVSGTWTGTMCLTESNAGSDLGLLKAKAVPNGDGTYAVSGTKIFITYGEHDLTENIIHFVLARLPDAPEGYRGISLFLVPKFLLNEDGTPGARNDVKAIGLEHKMGIHGSPTVTLQFGDDGGATGWLVGEENRGLNCMFTMMNDARLHVGIQGVAIGERAFQQALAYANERKQGGKKGIDGPAPIVEHADIRRMLLEMKSKLAAARAICYETAKALDLAEHAADEGARAEYHALAALLTPVAKAFGTDVGMEVASLGIQIHGGMGFIEETGAAQHLRDVRISQIYEGTNGIQALDLVGRKIPQGGGEVVRAWIKSQRDIAGGLSGELSGVGAKLSTAIDQFERVTELELQRLSSGDESAQASAAVKYLRAFALVAGTACLAKGAQNSGDAKRTKLTQYFATNHLPHVAALVEIITGGADENCWARG